MKASPWLRAFSGPLAAVLPPPDKRLRSRRPLQTGSPIRLLCGLAFALDQTRAG